jgi:hypothetical protein
MLHLRFTTDEFEDAMHFVRMVLTQAAILAMAAGSASAAVPENMRNRSFTVNWTETHNQSRDGRPFRDVSVPYRWTVYFSSAGRGFGRINIGSGRGAGSHEVVGKGAKSFGGGERGTTFTRSGFVHMSSFGEAARRISVEITGSGCTAHVTVGKLPGATTANFTHADGHHFEIRSLEAGAASCQMQDGNAFAH